MKRKLLALNAAASAVVLTAVVGFANMEDETPGPAGISPASPTPDSPEVLTVSATGNLDSPRTVGLPFAGTPGLVAEVTAKLGDTVAAGEVLARVDPRRARSALRHAQADLRSAKAALQIAAEGPTAAERRRNNAQISVGIQRLANAQQAVAQARETFRRAAQEQDALVAAAARELRAAERNVTRTASAEDSNNRITPITPAGSTTENRTENRRRAISATTSRSAVAQTHRLLVQAEETRASTLLQNSQAIRKLSNAATLSARELELARGNADVDEQGGTAGQIEAARAQIDEARAKVVDAREAVADTKLRAPFAGTVVSIAGDVGETPISAARGSAAPSGDGPGAAEDRNPATRSGFVVLADLATKTVTAAIAEADVHKIAVGQPAKVTFAATAAEVPGVVRAIDTEETVIGTVVTYDVKIALDESAAKLRLGQSASVRIVTGEREPRVVPNSAILRVGEHTVVQVRRGERAIKIPVTTTPAGPGTTAIRSSLLLPEDEVLVPDHVPARREEPEPGPTP